MFKFLKRIIGLFSSYVNPFERKVDRFFRYIKSTDSIETIKDKLLELMQENLMMVNVWTEKKFKGYRYLSKKVRRQMYTDVEAIVKKLEEHSKGEPVSEEKIKAALESKGLTCPAEKEKIRYLAEIMSFLKPGLFYKYIETASFGKLLRDPNKAKLEGDCNQIVTLYASFTIPEQIPQFKLCTLSDL